MIEGILGNLVIFSYSRDCQLCHHVDGSIFYCFAPTSCGKLHAVEGFGFGVLGAKVKATEPNL